MFDIPLPAEPEDQASPLEASDPDPYGGVALGVECAWPVAGAGPA
jgi:hypothetical protein